MNTTVRFLRGRVNTKAYAIYWTIANAGIIAGVWLRVFPWWMVAFLVTLDCVNQATGQWEKWFRRV